MDPIIKLNDYIYMIPFPHRLTLLESSTNKFKLEQTNLTIKTACGCTSRLSIAFAAGSNARKKIINQMSAIYGNIRPD